MLKIVPPKNWHNLYYPNPRAHVIESAHVQVPTAFLGFPEILLSATSYPRLIAVAESIKHHRMPSDIFTIHHFPQTETPPWPLPPSNLRTCICGTTIDPKVKHVFNCTRVSKEACHNRIRNGFAPVLGHLLSTAFITGPNTKPCIEPPNVWGRLSNCRPSGFSFRTDTNLHLQPPSTWYACMPIHQIRFWCHKSQSMDLRITSLLPTVLLLSLNRPLPHGLWRKQLC